MNEEISVRDLIKLISEIIGNEISIKQDQQRVRADKSEVERLMCNNSKLIKLTDWVPEFSLKSGLIETIEFLEANLDRYKPDLYNV
jgi:dTDP-glucose 4,6-dehydratase